MKTNSRMRRRNYLVNRGLQLRFVSLLFLQMGLILVFLSVLIYSHVARTTEIAAGIPFIDTQMQLLFQQEILANSFGFYMRALVLVAATCVLLAVFGVFASHKLAGPVVKLQRFLKAIADGNGPQRIAFRQYDNLDEFATSINNMAESIERRRSRPREIAARFLQSMELPDSAFERGHVLGEMENLVLEMKGAL